MKKEKFKVEWNWKLVGNLLFYTLVIVMAVLAFRFFSEGLALAKAAAR
ncbi:MAG: hypothetical protein IKN82_08200 [Treponema sp.]|nr:hypothetical protein [Treponema sp.]